MTNTSTKSTPLLDDDDVVEVVGEYGVLGAMLKCAVKDYIKMTDAGLINGREISRTAKWPAKLANTYMSVQDAYNLIEFLFGDTGTILLSTFTSYNFDVLMRMMFKKYGRGDLFP